MTTLTPEEFIEGKKRELNRRTPKGIYDLPEWFSGTLKEAIQFGAAEERAAILEALPDKAPHEECYLDFCEKCGAPRGYNVALKEIRDLITKRNV